MGFTISVSFIEFLRKFCVYDEIFDRVLLGKELLNLKGSKLGQILCADKQTWSHIVRRKTLEGQILALADTALTNINILEVHNQ